MSRRARRWEGSRVEAGAGRSGLCRPHAGAGEPADLSQVEKVLPQLVLRDPIGWFVVMGSKLPDSMGVGLRGSCGEAPQLHILHHAFT